MIDTLLSIVSVYFFVLIGYVAKMMLGEELDENGIVKLNIYFFLPILSFWGLLTQKIDLNVLGVPFVYLAITLLALAVSITVARIVFNDPKDIAIVSMASVTGITGSIGIPLGLILLSKASVIYTSLINTVSMFFVYTVGVYLYSRGSFGIRKSIINVFKMPIVWSSILAIVLNVSNITINDALFQTLEMGSYGAIVMQLIIFGAFLYRSTLHYFNWQITVAVLGLKFLLIPGLAMLFFHFSPLETLEMKSVLLELIVPIAITNISLASLFDCKPRTVTSLVFLTSLVFIPYTVVLGTMGVL